MPAPIPNSTCRLQVGSGHGSLEKTVILGRIGLPPHELHCFCSGYLVKLERTRGIEQLRITLIAILQRLQKDSRLWRVRFAHKHAEFGRKLCGEELRGLQS